MKSGMITALTRFPAKGHEGESVQSLKLVANCGIEDDWHKGLGEKQVSIISFEVKEWMKDCDEKGFCFQKQKENVTLCGIALEELKIGDILEIGEVKLQFISRKKCYKELCTLTECNLMNNEIFAKVIANGAIAVGDEVIVESGVSEKQRKEWLDGREHL